MAGPKAVAQYEAVRAKIAEGLSVGAAIKAVAEETGASAGTVHTNYYRVGRENGVVAARRNRRASDGNGTPTQELLNQAMTALEQLQQRAAEMEEDSKKLAELRRTLS